MDKRWGWISFLLILGIDRSIVAQVIPDTTLGSESSVVSPIDGSNARIDGGARRGGNLFHSFQQFNVGEGRSINFANPGGIDNILTRVTGRNPSNILGRLGVLGGANLFLLNPNGIIFGPKSSLNIQGSFVGTTADGIYLGDNGFFRATEPRNSNLLSVNPGVLFFNSVNQQPRNIISLGNLTVGKDLTLSAGNLRVNGLLTAGGNLTLQGLNVFSPDGIVIRSGGDVFLPSYMGRSLHILAGGQVEILGSIQIQRPSVNGLVEGITLSDGTVVSINGRTQPTLDIRAGGDINVGTIVFGFIDSRGNINPLKGTILLTNQSQPNSSLQGDIQITAIPANLFPEIVRPFLTGVAIQNSGVEGGGLVAVDSRGNITVNGTINVSAVDLSPPPERLPNTYSGNGGNVRLLSRDNIIFTPTSSIFSEGLLGGNITLKSEGTIALTQGNIVSSSYTTKLEQEKGDTEFAIDIEAGSLSLVRGTQVGTRTFGRSNAGNILVEVTGDVVSDGLNSRLVSTIEAGGVANTGTIQLDAGSLTLTDGGEIVTIVREGGMGNAGNINIHVRDAINLNGIDRGLPSGVLSLVESGVTGNTGDIQLRSSSISLSSGARILTLIRSRGQGNAGNIFVMVNDSLSISSGGSIESLLLGKGRSGDITINAANATISLDGIAILEQLSNSGKLERIPTISQIGNGVGAGFIPTGEGIGGDINITAKSISLTNGAQIGVNTFATGNAGNLYIKVTDFLSLTGGSLLRSDSFGKGNAGNITIDAPNASIIADGLEYLTLFDPTETIPIPSGIISIVGKAFEFSGIGNGGNISITAKSIALTNGAQITASNFTEGNAGNLTVEVTDFITLRDGSTLRTDVFGKGNSGILTINAPTATLSFDGSGQIPFFSFRTNEVVGSTTFRSGVLSSITKELDLVGEGEGGDIYITARSLSLTDGATISASNEGQGNAGSIAITAQNIRLDDGDITTKVNQGRGEGGNITLTANSLIAFDDSDILTFATEGIGGNITLNTPVFLGENYDSRISKQKNPEQLNGNGRVDINASGAISSGIIILPDLSFIQNSLIELPANLIDPEMLLTRSCVVPSREEGKFTITGSGGLPERPGINSISPYPTREVQTTDDDSSRRWQLGDPIVEPQGMYHLTDGKLVLSREC